MSSHLETFRVAICGYMETNGIIVNHADIADDIVIEAQGKIVQLRLVDRGTVLISTIVYFNVSGEEDINNELISEFNAFQMFKGGYRLMIEPETKCIYVEEGVKINGKGSEYLSNKLYDFVKRSILCTRWYIDKLKDLKLYDIQDSVS